MELEQIIRQKVIRETKTELDVSVKGMLDKVKTLQDICTHPNVLSKKVYDVGNHDPHEDRIWEDYHCPDCDKKWRFYEE